MLQNRLVMAGWLDEVKRTSYGNGSDFSMCNLVGLAASVSFTPFHSPHTNTHTHIKWNRVCVFLNSTSNQYESQERTLHSSVAKESSNSTITAIFDHGFHSVAVLVPKLHRRTRNIDTFVLSTNISHLLWHMHTTYIYYIRRAHLYSTPEHIRLLIFKYPACFILTTFSTSFKSLI